MVTIEEVLSELSGEDINEQGLPPGFRFHPTDEELITFYLASKVFKGTSSGVDIAEVDLNRSEPWELPDVAKMGEREWYFFSLRDRKYPTGLRTNRATEAGYWKATGKDREVYSASSGILLGMKKTLVFYKGRAPRGEKTKWVMHEYRLEGDFSYRHTCKVIFQTCKEGMEAIVNFPIIVNEEWVICRIFHKIGEKRGQVFHGQSYQGEATSSPTANSLTPLLEKTATTFLDCQSQAFRHTFDQILHQGSDAKTHFFPMNYGFQFHQPSFPPSPPSMAAAASSNSSLSLIPSSTFKAIFSHQETYLKEEPTGVQQCKREANFSHFQLSAGDTNLVSVDEIEMNPYDYESQPLLFDEDCSAMGTYAVAAAPDGAVAAPASTDTSISIPFNTAGFQMMLDLPFKLPAESWSLDV